MRIARLAICTVLAVAAAGCKTDRKIAAQDAFERGNQQLTKRQLPAAIIEYRRAVQADPQLGPARLQLAQAYASIADRPNALREYARAAELMPENDEAQIKAGNFMLLAGRFNGARKVGERLLTRIPKSVEAQVLIARAMAGLQDWKRAVDAFEKAVVIDPNRSATYSELGAAQVSMGHVVAAEAAFRKAVELDPKSSLALVSLANFVWSRGDAEQCEILLKRALEAESKNIVVNRALAVFYMTRNVAVAAEPYLKTVAEVTPNSEAAYALAEYYLRLRRIDEARAVIAPFRKDFKTYVGSSLRLARLETAADNKAEAHHILDGVLAREPNNAEALLLRGQLFLAARNITDALRSLERAVVANPSLIAPQLALAQTHTLRGSVKDAMKAYYNALKIDGSNDLARIGLANLQIASGQASDAIPLLTRAVAENPQNVDTRLLLMKGYIAVGDVKQATALANDLGKTAADSPAVQTAVGRLATLKKDNSGARQAYARALAADPRALPALAGLLNAEIKDKNFGAARALIEKHLAQKPNDPAVNLMAAQTYGLLGDAVEMEKALKKTVEADPHNLEAYSMLGRLYYQQGHLDLARIELEKFVSAAPESAPAHTMLGTILDLQGKKQDARNRYQTAIQVDPRAAVAANNLAWMDANTEGANLDVALQLAQTAKAQLANQPEVDDTLGWIYYKKGMAARAVEALENSTLQRPGSATYAYHLGMAYFKKGETGKAKSELERAFHLQPDFEGASEARRILASIK